MLVMVAMLDCAAMGEQGKSCCHHRHIVHGEDVVKYDSRLVREIKEQEKETTDLNENPMEDFSLDLRADTDHSSLIF